MVSRFGRFFMVGAITVSVLLMVSGCLTPEGAQEREHKNAAAAVEQVPVDTVDPSSDTAGELKVTWSAKEGTARQDPISLLSDTPLEHNANHLRAQRTVKFTPSDPDAKSATGKYVYVMDLVRQSPDLDIWTGTMKIDWTMTIVRSGSKSEYHAVYTAPAHATYKGSGAQVTGGAAGTAKTTDTFWAGGTKMKPRVTSEEFTWEFGTK